MPTSRPAVDAMRVADGVKKFVPFKLPETELQRRQLVRGLAMMDAAEGMGGITGPHNMSAINAFVHEDGVEVSLALDLAAHNEKRVAALTRGLQRRGFTVSGPTSVHDTKSIIFSASVPKDQLSASAVAEIRKLRIPTGKQMLVRQIDPDVLVDLLTRGKDLEAIRREFNR